MNPFSETCKIDVFAKIFTDSKNKGATLYLSDPITLYKLMILYADHVNFPLMTNSQLTDFFLDHEYTTYFTLQQALNELKEAGLIRMESTGQFLPP